MYSHCIRRQNNLPKLERLCVLRKGLGTVAERKLNMKTNTKKIAGVSVRINIAPCIFAFNCTKTVSVYSDIIVCIEIEFL